ncbi:MAG TPA: S8 family serine peptidase, partial [Phycisphaerae bacterium]|nr:S8 family serine peptidase [Phycisphaerae bacterium]
MLSLVNCRSHSIVLRGVAAICLVALAAGGVRGQATTVASGTDGDQYAKIHPTVWTRLAEDRGTVKVWVFFTDKGVRSPEAYAEAIDALAAGYNPRAVQRRELRGEAARGGPVFGEFDLPVVQEYVNEVAATGAKVHVTSKWVNAVSAWATEAQLARIAALACVDRVQPVARSRGVEPLNVADIGGGPFPAGERDRVDYGAATAQLTQINLPALHNAGYTGQGVIVGILDTGFRRDHVAFNNIAHPLQVIAEYDFVDNDGNAGIQPGDPSDQHSHGTMILGCLGAYMPGSLVGGAYSASFVLAKTEDTTGEYPAEEDNYVAGLEFIESHGADMETSSLGYIDWYTQAQLNGLTAVTTIAVNISTSLGIHHCNAAGNEYHDSNPAVAHLIAPADGFQVIACGAVNSSGTIASFSSDGPTADGRVKPEVLARGVSTSTVSPSSTTGYTTADGTSLSTPLVACAIACLVDAKPYWSVDQMRQHVFETADYFVQYGTFDPLYIRGYGIVNAFAAFNTCSDAGTVELDSGSYACQDTLTILVNDCGLNTNDQVVEYVTVNVSSTSEPAGEQVTLTETDPSSAEFLGSLPISTTDSTGVLLVAHGNVVTVTYIDANDGQGHYNVVVTDTAGVDCVAPQILNVQTTAIQPHSAVVQITANEPVRGTVYYGLSCG